MEDLTGIGKIVDSEIAKRAYEDAASEPARQVGHLATDALKALRLFTAPIQLLATAQDRFERWLGDLRDSVPEDRAGYPAPGRPGPRQLLSGAATGAASGPIERPRLALRPVKAPSLRFPAAASGPLRRPHEPSARVVRASR